MAYKVLGMLKDGGLDKDLNPNNIRVNYLSAMTRDKYLVTVQNGILWWCFSPLDTSDGPDAHYIYVMDGNGQIYTASKDEVVHHSAFLAGQPAAAAGHWKVIKGKVVRATAESGHYQPTADYCEQLIEELRKRGVKVDQIEKVFGATSDQLTFAMKTRKGFKNIGLPQETGGTVVTDYADGIVTKAGGLKIETGSHLQGQRLRLYPGSKPMWSWF